MTEGKLSAPDARYIDEIFGPAGALSTHDAHYESRPGQIDMARAVDRAIREKQHAVIEGPCGTGKSLAYLAAAVHHAVMTKRRVIVATWGIALSEQLITKDLPKLRRALPTPFTFAMLKGRGNYLCNDKRNDLCAGNNREALDGYEFEKLLDWAKDTPTGDRSEIPFVPEDRLWNRFSTDSDACKGKDCPSEAECFYRNARKATQKADVIVANHHILLADAWLRTQGHPGLFARADILVVDEAHELADAARGFFGGSIAPTLVGQLTRFVEAAARMNFGVGDVESTRIEALEAKKEATEIKKIGDHFFASAREVAWREIHDLRASGLRKPREDEQIPIKAVPGFEVGPMIAAVKRVSKRAATLLEHFDDKDKSGGLSKRECAARAKCRTASRRFARALIWLTEIATRKDENLARWINVGPANRVSLELRPVRVAKYLQTQVFADVPSVVLTSATLTIGGSFDFIERETGIEPTIRLEVRGPFDLKNRCLLVVPDGLPEPEDDAWPDAITDVLQKVVNVADGRTLALFSSKAKMAYVYKRITATDATRTWLKQGDLAPIELARRFHDDHRSVLFGNRTFYTGIDVPGESLVVVMIDRIPFQPQDDPVVMRMHELDPKAFWNYILPRAMMQLRQGVGRLIRTRNDFGVIVICDRRLNSSRWGRVAYASLPQCRRAGVEDIAAFLAQFRR